ncbi:MAG: DUF2254 domain-containing protein [Chloroflexi bacterium]|nr:DUF2254 domain-containing protein [Chloroflexota bacterium]
MRRSGALSRLRGWLSDHVELEHWLAAGIALLALFLLALTLFADWGIYAGAKGQSHLYLLSSIVQGLAAVLAVLVTVSLVATQLAAQQFTPHVIRQRLTDFWLWSAVFIYLAAIGWSLVVLGGIGSWIPTDDRVDRVSVNTALVLALAALLYLVPFTVANLKSLQPSSITWRMAQEDDHEALDDLLRKAVNDGAMTVVSTALAAYRTRVIVRLNRAGGTASEATDTAQLYRLVGRHACQRRSPDAVAAVMRQLTALTAYCSDYSRQWRAAADVFNDALKELYSYSEEWIGRPQS